MCLSLLLVLIVLPYFPNNPMLVLLLLLLLLLSLLLLLLLLPLPLPTPPNCCPTNKKTNYFYQKKKMVII
jgi:hypothetical protein